MIIAVAALIGVAQLIGPPKAPPPPRTIAERRVRNLVVFDAVWQQIDRHYYDRTFHGQDWHALRSELRPKASASVNDADLYNVLGNMTGRLHDSHTSAVPGNATDLSAAPGQVSIDVRCTRPLSQIDLGFWPGRSWSPDAVNVVADLRKDSPADHAGLEPGTELAEWTVTTVPCGPARANLDILPSKSTPERHVSYVVEQGPSEQSHQAWTLADGVRVLRFNSFNYENGAWLLAELRSAPVAGVILDLRHNSGGIDQVLDVVTGVLVGPGRPIGTWIDDRGRHPKQSRQLNLLDRMLLSDHITPDPFRYYGPLVVMIGPASTSAAEVLAQSLHFNGRAVLVGERTGGEVEAARKFWLPDGGVVEVSVADFEDPTGHRLENRGVVPDLFARQTLAAIRSGRDLVLEASDRAMTRSP